MNIAASSRRDAFNILFLCTHNSARSILAEGLANKLGKERLRGYSAGSQPSGVVNPLALSTLAARHYPIDTLRSKSWGEFTRPEAPRMDIVITVCGNAANEACPVWPGAPVAADWSCRDPSAVPGDERSRTEAFERTAGLIEQRLQRLLALPMETMASSRLAEALASIAQAVPDSPLHSRYQI